MSTLSDAIATYEEVKKKFQDEIKEKMKVAFKEFFEANPEVDLITWTQYTPWFNDGDTCEFSVGEIYTAVFVTEEAKEEYENGDMDYYQLENYGLRDWSDEYSTNGRLAVEKYGKERTDELIAAISAFSEEISNIPSEVMEAVFDNHVKVVATRDGFEVEEYEHD